PNARGARRRQRTDGVALFPVIVANRRPVCRREAHAFGAQARRRRGKRGAHGYAPARSPARRLPFPLAMIRCHAAAR
ncbi:hypothetical protein BS78_02G250500, partial [Paspalum vaginatum]